MADKLGILTLNSIAHAGLKRFPPDRYVVGAQVDTPDGILVRSQDMHGLQIGASVKAIGRAGAGTNNIPVARINANAVKELVIAGLLLAARNLIPAIRFVDGLSAADDGALNQRVEEGKKHFSGVELPNHALGVIGLGKIGSLVADSAIKLGMNVMGYDPDITVDAAWSLPALVRKAHSIEELVRASDFISVHVPLLEATRNLIDAKRISQMKHGAILLNFSRDGIVDNGAVVEALAAKRLKYYVCDFPAVDLAGHPQVIALPHLGASTREAEENCAVMVVDQLRDYLEHGNIRNAVNFPDVVMPRESPFRLGVANANVPNMVGQVSTALASHGLNIHNMINKSKGDMAYTLVDVDSPVPAAVLKEIGAITGVRATRYLPLEAE
jgi:D-3-phosphoglycerate dehydrogenase / 2-oxoglutarate reductase